ncbi:MAG: carboxymuconolactone decarboxylase family protein [Marinosulfonomonas sp.]|nr:carboxymuconolactone decarboxylase family protein [Marinosulfonomonas sp.]
MNWTKELATTNANLAGYRAVQSDTARGFSALHQGAMAPGQLDVKHKELMALAIGIAQQCTDCIGFHVKAAVKAGASRDEIAETISVCVMMGGGPSYMYGVKALEAFDQLCT